MANIQKVFSDSLSQLWGHKKIIVPRLLFILVPMLLAVLFTFVAGLRPIIHDLGQMEEKFSQEKLQYLKDETDKDFHYKIEVGKFIGYKLGLSTYDEEFDAYIDQQGYDWSSLDDVLTLKNLLLSLVFLLAGFLSLLFFSLLSYGMVASLFVKENPFRLALVSLFRYILLRSLITLIISMPFILILGIALFIFSTIPAFGIAFMVLGMLAAFVAALYLALRLLFVVPVLFIEKAGPVQCLRRSWELTQRRMKEVLIILVIIFGVSLAVRSFLAEPLGDAFWKLFLGNALGLNIVLLALFLVMYAAGITFQLVFLFRAYKEFSAR